MFTITGFWLGFCARPCFSWFFPSGDSRYWVLVSIGVVGMRGLDVETALSLLNRPGSLGKCCFAILLLRFPSSVSDRFLFILPSFLFGVL